MIEEAASAFNILQLYVVSFILSDPAERSGAGLRLMGVLGGTSEISAEGGPLPMFKKLGG